MIIVQMNEDIRKKEVKSVGRFTFRQIICLAVGFAYAVPIAIAIPADIAIKLLIGVALIAPAGACGWVKSQGQHFETLALRFIYKKFLTPRLRRKKDLAYVRPKKMLKKEKELEKLRRMTPPQREAYKKARKKGITVAYGKRPVDHMFR